ncbi:MAG: GlsB/YeaQ/YmgE family stress response membrane protein [Promethearchaeota archaeon]
MASTSFFNRHTYERLDTPHPSAHGDPWKSEEAYPEVFWWKNVWIAAASWLPVPGIGSYYPHLFLALAAEYFFRSFIVVILGVFMWSLFIEVPVYYLMHWMKLLPNNRSVWTQFVVYDKRKPTQDEIEKALSYKKKYEKPESGEYYAVFIARSAGLSPWGAFRAREDMMVDSGHGRIKEVYGIFYRRRDFSSYVLWAILLDILLGVLGAWIGSYLWYSFGLESFRDSIDGALVGEFIGLFFIIAHLASFWGWLFTPIAFGYIFILGAANLDQHVFSWTPYLVFFGVTFYYWISFFRNPLPTCLRAPWLNPARNADTPAAIEEVSVTHAQPMMEHQVADESQPRRRRSIKTPESVRETAAAEATVDEYGWSWWVFSATTYETFGYQAWFSSMILLIVIAIVALAL